VSPLACEPRRSLGIHQPGELWREGSGLTRAAFLPPRSTRRGRSAVSPDHHRGILEALVAFVLVPLLRYFDARRSKLRTEDEPHGPPRAVRTPRAFSVAAISRNEVRPAAWMSRTIGKTLAAN